MRVAAIVGVTVTMLAVAAAPASAYSGPAFHGADYAQTIGINDDIVQVCDREADNHAVFVEYFLNDGTRHIKYDENGSAPPCYIEDWTQTPFWIDHYRVCENFVGCSGFVFTDGIGGQATKVSTNRSGR